MVLVNEIWKDIPNYEGLYQVSNLGRVKSLERLNEKNGNQILKERILKIYVNTIVQASRELNINRGTIYNGLKNKSKVFKEKNIKVCYI